MDDSLKYLIHARITADGVVDRTDVVGAVFGQTEGLLGEELDIRGLQESAKLGRLDVEVESENGQSFAELTIGSGLDKAETAILAAALETIERVGPCTASVEVTRIEDVRAAKRRAVVDRAKELLATGFDESTLSSAEIVDEVRASVHEGQIAEFAGLPAGPTVAEGDAVIIVEGRADVRRLLEFGIKNAIAVEGTDVPEAVADLTRGRTTTAFLDGDRGGDLILRELAQVGDVDYVARAPTGRSVEDLSRDEVTTALREKRALDRALEAIEDTTGTSSHKPDHRPDDDAENRRPQVGGGTDRASTDGSGIADVQSGGSNAPSEMGSSIEGEMARPTAESRAETGTQRDVEVTQPGATGGAPDSKPDSEPGEATTVPAHAAEVIGQATGTIRLLDDEGAVLVEGHADEALTLIAESEDPVTVAIIDDVVGQEFADEMATRDIDRIVARERGGLVKTPAAVRIHTWDEVAESEIPSDP